MPHALPDRRHPPGRPRGSRRRSRTAPSTPYSLHRPPGGRAGGAADRGRQCAPALRRTRRGSGRSPAAGRVRVRTRGRRSTPRPRLAGRDHRQSATRATTATCPTISRSRGAARPRPRRGSGFDLCFRSPTMSPRVICQAGPSPKNSVPTRQNPSVPSRTRQSTPMPETATANGRADSIERTSAPAAHTATTRPTAPPPTDSTNPSVSN